MFEEIARGVQDVPRVAFGMIGTARLDEVEHPAAPRLAAMLLVNFAGRTRESMHGNGIAVGKEKTDRSAKLSVSRVQFGDR